MLTENNFHHRNTTSVNPPRRNHYAPYPHSTHAAKSTQQAPSTSSELQPSIFDLHHAVRTNDVSGIALLHSRLRQQPTVADTCLLNPQGHTPLYTAIAHGRLKMVDLLLHLGHNPVSNNRE